MTLSKIEITDESQLFLVGFRIDAENENTCDFYTLYVDSERPIDCDGYPIITLTKDNIQQSLDLSTCGCKHLPFATDDDLAFIDIAQAVFDIGTKDKTDNANIIDCLNMILDFVSMFHEERVNKVYKKLLRDAANHFTFHYEIKDFFDKKEISREELIWAIEWAVGALLLWAKYVR